MMWRTEEEQEATTTGASEEAEDADEDDEAELERDLAASEPDEWLKLANCAMSAHISSSIPPKWGYKFATSIAKLGEEATLARTMQTNCNLFTSQGPSVIAILVDGDNEARMVVYDPTHPQKLFSMKFGFPHPIPAWFSLSGGGRSSRVQESRRALHEQGLKALHAIWSAESPSALEDLLSKVALFPIRGIAAYRPPQENHPAQVRVKWKGPAYKDAKHDSWLPLDDFASTEPKENVEEELLLHEIRVTDPRVLSAYRAWCKENEKEPEKVDKEGKKTKQNKTQQKSLHKRPAAAPGAVKKKKVKSQDTSSRVWKQWTEAEDEFIFGLQNGAAVLTKAGLVNG
eukprot:COSAG05_NODE_258_length_12741_cov_168.778279_11_plen_343_part_00